MIAQEKVDLVKLMDETRARTLALFEQIAGDTVIYADGNWALRDVINHLTIWEEEAVNTLLAYIEGQTYSLNIGALADLNAFNDRTVDQRRHLSAEQAYANWEATRIRLKTTFGEIPPHKIETDFPFPWGEEGNAGDLIRGMVGHEAEHYRDVKAATRQS